MADPISERTTEAYRSWRDWLPWRPWLVPAGLSVLFLAVGVPLFLRMPLWCDISLYDTAAKSLLTGGIHFRDVFDTNLPGYVWILSVIRSIVGWSSEALRVVDLIIFATTLLLLDRLTRMAGATRRTRWWAVAGACAFYPFTTEFVHAQRDVWLAIPALLAVQFRLRRAIDTRDPRRDGGAFAAGCLEGVLWAIAVWIKPHMLTVAAPVWLLTAGRLACCHLRPWRALGADFMGNIVGGAVIGAIGVAQLVASGTWHHFWNVMTEWNPSYSEKAFIELPFRVQQELFWFPPWSWFLPLSVLLSLLAIIDARPWSGRFRDGNASPARWILRNTVVFLLMVPLAVFRLSYLFLINPVAPFVPSWVVNAGRWVAELLHDPTSSDRARFVRAGLGILYLAWVTQSFVLQRGFPYVHAAEILLMLALWSAHRWCLPVVVLGWMTITSVMMMFAVPGTPTFEWIERFEESVGRESKTENYYFVRHPLSNHARLKYWPACFRTGLTPAEYYARADALRMMGEFEASPNWSQLHEVAEYLRSRTVGDRELVAWHDSTHPLYLMLGVKPGLRFMHVNTAASIDPYWSPQVVVGELNGNPKARFAVADVESMAYFAQYVCDVDNAYAAWWALPTDPTAPPLPPSPMRVPTIRGIPVNDFEFPFDRNPLLPLDSPKQYPFDRRPVLFRTQGGKGRYIVFELCQPIRAVFERP